LPAVEAADASDRFYHITQSPKHEIYCKLFRELYTDECGVKPKMKVIFVVHRASIVNSA
jgi:hypothetical protein